MDRPIAPRSRKRLFFACAVLALWSGCSCDEQLDDGNACTVDYRDPDSGAIRHDPVDVDDQNACTVDSCDPATGVHHDPVTVDDGNACTADSCDPATGVRHDPVAVDDQNVCTVDSCDPATGVRHDPVAVDDGNACTADSCDPTTGVRHDPVAVDDQNVCTVDSCDPAAGVRHDPVAVDDQNACTVDSCDAVAGVRHDPVPIDDQNACTVDSCNPASGVRHDPVLIDDQNACTADSCNPASGVRHDLVPIDDQNACTADSCDPLAGVRHDPVPVDDQNVCTVDSCNPASGVRHDPVPIDDQNACTADTCDPVAGVRHDPVPVDDQNACTADSCNPASGVRHDPVPVDDQNACTADSCDPVAGVRHDPIPVDDQNVCTVDSCDPASGVRHDPVPVDDQNACTADSCDPIAGVRHDPVPVDDQNACTADSCDPMAGVRHDPVPVDDQNVCTVDSCDPGSGVRHDPVPVDDQNACTADSCDPVAGVRHDPIPVDDQNVCTMDSCDPGSGVRHDPISVDDQNACTADSCDPIAGVRHDPVPIDDDNECTEDSCDPGSGVSHDPVPVDDQNACTVDVCDPADGSISHNPVPIDDQNVCTADSCDPLAGVRHDPVPVDDQNVCTADSCDPASGVRHDPVPIDDQNACTADSCDPASGVSHDPVPIDDQNVCTVDACDPSSGVSHTPVSVDDGIACTSDSCDPQTGIRHDPVHSVCETDGRTCTVGLCSATTGCSELPNDSICGDPTGCPAARCAGASGAPVTGCVSTLVDLHCGALQVCRPSGCAPAAPGDQVGNVVVSELSVLGQELVEISNPGPTAVDIRGFMLGNFAGQAVDIRAVTDLDGGLATAVVLPAGGQLYGVPNPVAGAPPAGAAFVYGAPGAAFALADTGDVISLYSRGGNTLQDHVDFRDLASGARVPVGPTSFVVAPGLTTQVDPASRDALANDAPIAWCTTFYPSGTTRHRAYDTAGAANGSCSSVVISELVANPDGGDDGRTYVELAGPGGMLVGGMALLDVVAVDGGTRFVDGDFGPGEIDGEYRLPAGTRLPPGGHLVIADGVNSGAQGTSGSLVLGLVAGVDLIARDMDLQDGPASLQLLAADGGLRDVVAHHNPLGLRVSGTIAFNGHPLQETSPAVSAPPYASLSRTSAADDRADNRVDLMPGVPTPGAENYPVHLWLGKPDNSSFLALPLGRYLAEKRQFTLSYNGLLKNPNWSAWEMNAFWSGPASRQDTYRADNTLPASIPQAALSDYSSSGWDRGHMCPSADRNLDTTDNSATFYLTNMIPQSSNNNQGAWADLEQYSRCLVTSQGRQLYIISGGLYEGPDRYTKPGSTVRVPSHTWKVITVMNAPGQGPADVNFSTRVIGVIMPNDDSLIDLNAQWRNYRVTARHIEQRTGLNVMSQVPPAIQDVIETALDTDGIFCGGF